MGWVILTPIGKIGKNFIFFRIPFYFFDVLKNEQYPQNQLILIFQGVCQKLSIKTINPHLGRGQNSSAKTLEI